MALFYSIGSIRIHNQILQRPVSAYRLISKHVRVAQYGEFLEMLRILAKYEAQNGKVFRSATPGNCQKCDNKIVALRLSFCPSVTKIQTIEVKNGSTQGGELFQNFLSLSHPKTWGISPSLYETFDHLS